jgi:hypothetical protein
MKNVNQLAWQITKKTLITACKGSLPIYLNNKNESAMIYNIKDSALILLN